MNWSLSLKAIKAKYDVEIYLEPGEAVALDAGILVGEVLDVTRNGDVDLAIMDISATCHMPDVIEAPYRPALLGEPDAGKAYRLGGPSCLAGDVIGDYKFPADLALGDRIAFLDQAHYSMVKTNTFNGVRLPSIAIWDSETDALEIVRRFPYEEFRDPPFLKLRPGQTLESLTHESALLSCFPWLGVDRSRTRSGNSPVRGHSLPAGEDGLLR